MSKRPLAPLALFLPGAGSAGALAPGKASDLVTLVIGDNTPCPSAGTAFNTMLLTDGSEQPFAIPAKRVLVVTGFDFVADGPDVGGQTGRAVLSQQNGAVTRTLLQGVAVTDPNGVYAGSAHTEPGIAVAPGWSLCLIADGSFAGILHGYFAKDK
jgi:hypothetical protein